MTGRPAAAVVAAAVLLVACSTEPSPVQGAALTEARRCGHAFAVGTAQEDARLTISLVPQRLGPRQDPTFDRSVDLPHPAWEGELVTGRRLFGNWCNDVAGPETPTPDIVASYVVTGGRLEVSDGQLPRCNSRSLTATVDDLEVTSVDGRTFTIGDVDLGDVEGWGCFAG